jgi:hypothetical protein
LDKIEDAAKSGRSKIFIENHTLGELTKKILEEYGFKVTRFTIYAIIEW